MPRGSGLDAIVPLVDKGGSLFLLFFCAMYSLFHSFRAQAALLFRVIAPGIAALALAFLMQTSAHADLRLCNQTPNRAGVAIGYQDGTTWVTEGWFNLKGNGCEIILKGKLNSRYYYVFAVDYDRGGEWSGSNYLCTRDQEFSIRGPQDCYARGFERSGFLEIDTGEQADWTIELGEGGQVGGRSPGGG